MPAFNNISRRIPLPDLFLISTALIYYLSFMADFPFGIADEGYLYYVAFALQQGQLPYQDIQLYNYLPGPFYLFSAVFELFGPNILAARSVMAIGLALVPWLLYRNARRFVSTYLAFAIALVILLVPGPWHKFYINLLGLALVYCAVGLYRDWNKRWALAYGLVLGLAFIMRMDIAIAGFLALPLLLWGSSSNYWRPSGAQTRRAWAFKVFAWVGLGFVVLNLPYQIFLWQQGLIGDMYQQYIEIWQRLLQRSETPGLAIPSIAVLLDLDFTTIFPWLYYGSFIAILVLGVHIFLSAINYGDESNRHRTFMLLIVFFWVLTNLPQYVIERPDLGHITQRSGAIFLPIAIILQQSLTILWTHPHVTRRLVNAIIALLITTYSLFYTQGLILYHHPSSTWYQLSNGISFPDRGNLAKMVEYVLKNSDDLEPVAAYPYIPGFNFLSGRLMPGRHVYLIPRYINDKQQQEVINDLRRVRFVFYRPGQNINKISSSEPTNYMSRVDAVIRTDFHPVLTGQGVILFERNKQGNGSVPANG